MACVSSKAEVKGITERVPVMKGKKEKIDLLFERNAAEQLGGVDWDRLNAAISTRLDKAQQSKTSTRKYPTVFKIAAGVAAAAAVVLISVMIKTEKLADLQLEKGTRAVVKFIESRGTASVEIKGAAGTSQVSVSVGGSERRVARCDVKIIDLNGDFQKDSERATWIIISRPGPEPVYVDNGLSSDMMGMIYLF